MFICHMQKYYLYSCSIISFIITVEFHLPMTIGYLQHQIFSICMYIYMFLLHRVPRHIYGHGFVKVWDTDLKRRFHVSWCEIINYSIITII